MEQGLAYTTYGDVRNLNPTGKSKGGVAASNEEVDFDMKDLNHFKPFFIQAGKENGIQPALIAALASRESRGGRLLKSTNGWGDHGNAYGILQCDKRFHSDATKHAWDSKEHIIQMIHDILVPYIKQVTTKHPSWTKDQHLQGGVAAYNFGVKNVQSWGGLDRGTTGNDYSNDVIARAQRLIDAYGWE